MTTYMKKEIIKDNHDLIENWSRKTFTSLDDII